MVLLSTPLIKHIIELIDHEAVPRGRVRKDKSYYLSSVNSARVCTWAKSRDSLELRKGFNIFIMY